MKEVEKTKITKKTQSTKTNVKKSTKPKTKTSTKTTDLNTKKVLDTKKKTNPKTEIKHTPKKSTKSNVKTNPEKEIKPTSKKSTKPKIKTEPSKRRIDRYEDNSPISKKVVPKKETKLKKQTIPKDTTLKELEQEIKKDIKSKKVFSKKIVIPIILLIILIIIFVTLHLIPPTIRLNGKSYIEISYNDKYVEQGATSSFFNKDVTKKITITSNIDNNKIGTYKVIYKIKHTFFNIKKERIVKIIDNKKPTITLVGTTEVNVCQNKEYKELGYQALDEYDGDITNKVKINKSKDKITYSVKDKSGNSYSITRKISIRDITKPTITLKGNSTMYLGLEDTFTEPGYTASDNCDGNLTNKVITSGEVISGKLGTYTITYQVTDSSNNKTIIKRTVIVSKKTNPDSGVYKNGAIYLTFDDGPSSVTTGEILDILKEENVKATFFVTNNGPDYLIKRIYDEGHTIALHTASHNYGTIYSSVDAYFRDLKSVSDRVKRLTGHTSKIVRFPGGSSNTVSRKYSQGIMTRLSQELFNRGYRYYDWNIDSKDASTAKNKQAVYNNVVKNLSKDKMNMILMHDIKTWTRDAVRSIIKYGKENGYTFERIDMDTKMIRQRINN